MKTFLSVLFFVAAMVWAQGTTLTSTGTRNYNGYDYELWSEDNIGNTSMTLTGDNGSGANAKGGTFTCSWQNSLNILFRSGKKWGMTGGPTPKSAGNISIDFDATWSSNDGARMLGVYGWAFYPSGSIPTKDEAGTTRSYSDQIEYYIIQDRGGYNPATGGDAQGGGKKKGEATIDGIVYEFYVADRINRWALTGNGNVTFKQYFSVPKATSSQRTKGIISVSKHFEEWENAGMKMMDCRLYEVAMKVESYTNGRNGSGNATVTKNLLTIGGSSTPTSSNSGGGTSSNSAGGTSSSSGSNKTQATTCKTPLVTYPTTGGVPSDPYTACFKYTDGKCYVCKIENEGDGNTCSSNWVWNGTEIDKNLTNGYWYQEVTCPATSSSSVASSSSRPSSSSVASSSSRASSSSNRSSSSVASSSSSSSVATGNSSSSTANNSSNSSDASLSSSSTSDVETQSSSSSSDNEVSPIMLTSAPHAAFNVRAMSNGALLVESNANAAIYLYDTKGNLAQKIQVSAGANVVQTAVPVGIYVVKNASNRQTQIVVVK